VPFFRFERYKENSKYKYCGIGWLLLRISDIMKTGNDDLGRFITNSNNCEIQRSSSLNYFHGKISNKENFIYNVSADI
jgi:hypothetical protein